MTVSLQNSNPDIGMVVAGTNSGAENEASVRAETLYQVECYDSAGNLKWIENAKNRVVTTGLNKLLDATFKTGLTTPTWYVGLVGAGFSDGVTNSNTTFSSATAAFAGGDASRAIIIRAAGTAGADLVTTISSVTNATHVVLANAAASSATSVKFLFDARAADTTSSHTSWSELTAYSESVRQTFTPGTIASGSVDNSGAKATFTINADNTLVGGLFLSDNNGKANTTSGTLYGMAPFSTVGFRQVNNGDTLQITATLTMTAT